MRRLLLILPLVAGLAAIACERIRTDPGGPDQLTPALPNLRITGAEPNYIRANPGGPDQLVVTVVNDGAAAAAKTALKFSYTEDGVTTTASTKVDALPAGGADEVSIGIDGKPLVDADLITLEVDDADLVPETLEDDNSFIYEG